MNENIPLKAPVDSNFISKLIEYCQQHPLEVWIALILAVVFAFVAWIFMEVIKKLFHSLYKKFIGKKIGRYKKKRTLRDEIPLHETEIHSSISSNYNPIVSSEIIADAIKKHDALIEPKRFHYLDPTRKYHICRKFKLFPMFNGGEVFLDRLARELFLKLSLDAKDSDFVLSLRKWTNKHFSKLFAADCKQRTKFQFLDYMEYGDIEYKDGDSLEGTKVLLLESFMISPEIIKSSILKIQSLGGTVEGIVILFCAASVPTDFSSCLIKPENVIVGCYIDLKRTKLEDTTCLKAVKPLKYIDY